MHQVTFLGPYGATFSHDAYTLLADLYKAPTATAENYVPADNNTEVLRAVIAHGGYGAIAIHSLAKGRVAEPVESFIELLASYSHQSSCPITVIGGVRMTIHFHLMARPGVGLDDITHILAHEAGACACRRNLVAQQVPIITMPSNGAAARQVAKAQGYAHAAALGPQSAANQYGLTVLNNAFEDEPAATTFALIGPATRTSRVGTHNRAFIVFEVAHQPNALAKSLCVLGEAGFNLIHVHSRYVGNGAYHFLAEVDVAGTEVEAFRSTLARFAETTSKHLVFGPFEVSTK